MQLRVQDSVQLLQFSIALHLPELLLRFRQLGGGPAGEVVAAPPAFHVAGHVPHRRQAGLDDELRQVLFSWWRPVRNAGQDPAPRIKLTDELKEKLRSLGYME